MGELIYTEANTCKSFAPLGPLGKDQQIFTNLFGYKKEVPGVQEADVTSPGSHSSESRADLRPPAPRAMPVQLSLSLSGPVRCGTQESTVPATPGVHLGCLGCCEG